MNEQEFLEQADKLDGGSDTFQKAEETKEIKAEAEERDTEELSPTQQEAYKSGWRPKEEFKGDPDNWTSASAYIKFQKLQKQVSSQKAEFEKQLRENNDFNRSMHKTQLEMQRKQFEAERDAAVEEGDTEAFKRNQKQIDDLASQERKIDSPAEVDTNNDPDVASWLARNSWIDSDAPKANYADALFEQIKGSNPGITTRDALDVLDEKLEDAFPTGKSNSNPRRTAPSSSETSTRKAGTNSKRALSMSDLSEDEKDFWRIAGKSVFGGNQKKFLESVKNSRV
jgi:hypothetical protein